MVQQRFEFEGASGVQSLYVQAGLVKPPPAAVELIFIFVGQRQVKRPFVAVFDVDAARRLQVAGEIGVDGKAGNSEVEELVIALSLDQRGERAGGSVSRFAAHASPFVDDDANPGDAP